MTNLAIPYALKEIMPPRRTTSSQNSQANDGVPHSLEGLPPMNAEGLYKYLRTLAGLVG